MNTLEDRSTEDRKKQKRKEGEELRDKILYGLELAYDRLVERTRKNNDTLAIIKDGKVIEIKP